MSLTKVASGYLSVLNFLLHNGTFTLHSLIRIITLKLYQTAHLFHVMVAIRINNISLIYIVTANSDKTKLSHVFYVTTVFTKTPENHLTLIPNLRQCIQIVEVIVICSKLTCRKCAKQKI